MLDGDVNATEGFLQNNDILKRLSQGLLNFKQASQNQAQSQSTYQDIQNNKKWGDVQPVNRLIIEEIIQKLSETLNLDALQTFDLLDSYFITNDVTKKQLGLLDSMAKSYENQQMQLQNMMPVQNQFQGALRLSQRFQQEFNILAKEVLSNAQQCYFEERRCLFQALFLVLEIQLRYSRSNLVQPLLQGDVIENLIKSLEFNIQQYETWKRLEDQDSVIQHLQREEILILKCLFQLYKHHTIPKTQQIIRFLNYQIDHKFKGHLSKNEMMFAHLGQSKVQYQKTIITDLSILTSLVVLQVHLFAEQKLKESQKSKQFSSQLFSDNEQFKQLHALMDNMELTDVTSIVYLAYRQILNIIKVADLFKAFGLPQDKAQLLNLFDFKKKTIELQRLNFIDQIANMNDTHKYFEEEFVDKRGELNFLIQDLLNLIYPFLLENKMKDEQTKSLSLSFEILMQPVHLTTIWQQIENTDKSKLLGNKDVQKKVRYHTLDIFEDILKDPVENVGDFCKIMQNLCGNKSHKHENQVVTLLEGYTGSAFNKPQFQHLNLLQILILKFESDTKNLENEKLSNMDLHQYLSLAILLGKIIYLNPLLYNKLNEEYLLAQANLNEQERNLRRAQRGKQNQYQYEANEPMLSMLIRALHALFKQDLSQVQFVIKSLLKAISRIYSKLNLQSEILMHLMHFFTEEQKTFQIIEFFKFSIDNFEFESGEYRITKEILRFVNSVFSKQYPQGYLQDEERIEFRQSIIYQLLTEVYLPLCQNYFQLKFSDVTHYVTFSYRLLKITNSLLNKYKDVNPLIKAQISHKLPQFDPMHQVVTDTLNQFQLNNILSQVLTLSEDSIDNAPTGLQNKFWIDQLIKGRQDFSQTQYFHKLIATSLKCFNSLLELALIFSHIQNISTADQYQLIGTRAYYLTNLDCVQQIYRLAVNPGQAPQIMIKRFDGSEIAYSLFNIIQYYVKPSQSLSKFINNINIEALQFMLNCCNIWSVPAQTIKVNFESILRFSGSNSSEIRAQYIINFKDAIAGIGKFLPLQYLNTFFDLLITSASSQQSFLNDLCQDPNFKLLFLDFVTVKLNQLNANDVIRNSLLTDVKSKVIILLSEMSTNRVGVELLKNITENNNLKNLYQKVVTLFIPVIMEEVSINYFHSLNEDPQLQLDLKQKNSTATKKVYKTCQAYFTLKSYFKLLQTEYSNNIDNQNVREAISNLISEENLMSNLHKNFNKFDEIYQEIHQLNISLSQDVTLRHDILAKEFLKNIERSHQIQDQQRIFIQNSKLLLDYIFVYINQLDAQNLLKFLSSSKDLIPQLMQQQSITNNQFSKIGSELIINTEEFSDILRNYYYTEDVVIEAKIIAAKYNMLLSYYFSYNQFTESIRSFILSVGKTRSKENLRNKDFILQNKVINTSLFVLAESRDPKEMISNNAALGGFQSTLVKKMATIAKSLVFALTSRNQVGNNAQGSQQDQVDIPRSAFEIRQLETDIDLLTIILGAINTLTTIAPLKPDNLPLDFVKDIIKILPALRIYQMQLINLKEGGQSQKSIYEQNAAVLYVNLVLQVLSIYNVMNEVKQAADMQKSSILIMDQQSDMDLIHIISSVVKLMNERDCFLAGLQILEISVNLLMTESISRFFQRQENSPLKMLIQRLTNPGTIPQECIKIVEFFIKFATIEKGAEILYQESILQNICKSSLINQVNSLSDCYIQDIEVKRHPYHILWCQVLIFIRAMNAQITSNFSNQKLISEQLYLLKFRSLDILQIPAILDNPNQPSQFKVELSLATIEEIDLTTGILQQIFENIDLLDGNDFITYCEFKEKYLFSLVILYSMNLQLKTVSATESYLNTLVLDKLKENQNLDSNILIDRASFSGFELIIQVEKIRSFLNMNATMVNLLVLNQLQQFNDRDYINTWNRDDNLRVRGSIAPRMGGDWESMSQTTQFHPNMMNFDTADITSLDYLLTSVRNYLQALDRMNNIFAFWTANEGSLSDFYKDVYAYMNNDEWINIDYLGLNAYLGGSTFIETMEQFEVGMQMGYLACTLLLQQLVDLQKQAENEIGGRISVSLRDLMDCGDTIKQLYQRFIPDVRNSKVVKESMDQFGPAIQKVVESIKNSPQYDERLY
eukprot:403357742